MSQLTPAKAAVEEITYLDGPRSSALDADLMSAAVGFTLDQLMELAALSCASAIEHFFPVRSAVLVVCGPGNNGGDGLVCARHLKLFGYSPTVVLPKEPKSDFFRRLISQLRTLDVPIVANMPAAEADSAASASTSAFPLIVDAVFGFSFDPKDGVRQPYKDCIERMIALQSSSSVISIDVPSGWDVSRGDVSGSGLRPALLISLTAPKECARTFKEKHALGGRFMPESILKKHAIRIPPYEGSAQFIDISQSTQQQSQQ